MDDLRESEGVPETFDFLDEGPPGVDAPGEEGFEEMRRLFCDGMESEPLAGGEPAGVDIAGALF